MQGLKNSVRASMHLTNDGRGERVALEVANEIRVFKRKDARRIKKKEITDRVDVDSSTARWSIVKQSRSFDEGIVGRLGSSIYRLIRDR